MANDRTSGTTSGPTSGSADDLPGAPANEPNDGSDNGYRLEQQVGHLLRRANQRHAALFAERFAHYQLTPLQFAALMRLREHRALSQNRLGRLTAMDPNTIQGVVGRLTRRGLIERRRNSEDRRRLTLVLTPAGDALTETLIPLGFGISAETLVPLDEAEQQQFLALLQRLI